MNYTPRTREEIEAEKREFATNGLLPKGWYDFEVMQAEEAVSKKSGKDMIKLKLRVFAPDGGEKHVYDYLIDSAPTRMFDFCETVGLLEKYSAGTLEAIDCEQRAGRCQLGIDDRDPKYEPKNVVKAYASPKQSAGATTRSLPGGRPPSNEPEDDDIPF